MGKRELIALLNLSSWCLVTVGRFFLAVPQGCLQFVIVVFPDHTHLLFLNTHCSPSFMAFKTYRHLFMLKLAMLGGVYYSCNNCEKISKEPNCQLLLMNAQTLKLCSSASDQDIHVFL